MIDTIICGAVPDALLEIPDGTIQTCITSPPYWGLRDYQLVPIRWDGDPECDHEWQGHHQKPRGGNNKLDNMPNVRANCHSQTTAIRGEGIDSAFCAHCGAWLGCLGLEPTPELYVDHLVQIFREVKRVLRDDGMVWLNIGDSYAGGHSTYNGKDAKWQHGANNRILTKRTLGGPGLKPKDMVLIPFRLALALQSDGWWIRSDIIWEKPNCMPSSVKDRPTTSHEHVFLLAKSKRYFYDQDAIAETCITGLDDKAHHTFGAPGGKAEKVYGKKHLVSGKRWVNNGTRNKRTVWTIPTKPYKGAHFATFPPDLIEPMILAGSSDKACPHCGAAWTRVTERVEFGRADTDSKLEDGIHDRSGAKSLATKRQAYRAAGLESPPAPITTGFKPSCGCPDNDGSAASIVLDPFAGSGTTCAVAKAHGRHWIGIEPNAEYCELARKRIRDTQAQLKLDLH